MNRWDMFSDNELKAIHMSVLIVMLGPTTNSELKAECDVLASEIDSVRTTRRVSCGSNT